jgi:TonB-dependent SusC/RagA subfamily outer membrane receptor
MKKIRYYYRLISMMIILMFLLTGQNLFAQSVEVSGIIKDQKGETIIGATVMEKGTTNGSVTNVNGEFRLTVSRNDAVLTVSFIGYQPQEIPLNGKKSFNITLAESVSVLNEVVVVGYGSQKKESVVGAISQLSTDQILSTAATNITQAISGKISGVTTSQASGTPGSDNAKIYIRGRATFAGDGQPLVLVDGVEREFSQIAPDDIQAISVLKDASATAVYGVRGANGVILVTTKRGRDQKPVVSLTTSWQSQ